MLTSVITSITYYCAVTPLLFILPVNFFFSIILIFIHLVFGIQVQSSGKYNNQLRNTHQTSIHALLYHLTYGEQADE